MREVTQVIARLPLRWRLALISFGLLAILMMALGVLVSVTEENALLSSQANSLRTQASIIATTVSVPIDKVLAGGGTVIRANRLSDDFANSIFAIVHQAAGKSVNVLLLTHNGDVMQTDQAIIGRPAVIVEPRKVRTSEQSQVEYLLVNDSQGQRQLVELWPLELYDKNTHAQVEAVLQLSVPTTPIDQSVTTTRLILFLGIAGALIVAAALTLPLMSAALRPLREMEHMSTRIAHGNLSLRLQEPVTRDEVGQLARSFNLMVARLEKVFGRQKQFVADVSHELRTPLTGLGGSLEMLLLEANDGDTEAAHRLMRGMYVEVERMQRLVEDLLVLSRLDEGQMLICKEKVDMEALLEGIYAHAQQLACGQKLSCAISSPLPAIYGNADQLRRVLLNLIENALKFTSANECISLVACATTEGLLLLEVRDTGIGIPSAALPYVFDRFYRVDQSRTRSSQHNQSGSGLGLSIARGLVNAYAGTIEIHSNVGEGTKVTVLLPSSKEM
jgi:two-component system, OmpR family, sensor kinase